MTEGFYLRGPQRNFSFLLTYNMDHHPGVPRMPRADLQPVGFFASGPVREVLELAKQETRANKFGDKGPSFVGLTQLMAKTPIGETLILALRSAGVIAGGAVREVLELGGVKNAFGKQLGSDNPLNNARAAVDGLMQLRTIQMAARNRDLTVEQMLNYKGGLCTPQHLAFLFLFK